MNTPTTAPASQVIRVGHSPDPDDAFMFYALAADKIDTGPYRFVHELVDIETLNRRAFAGELELTALSIHAYAHLADTYVLCPCGASMGDGYGPIVVAKKPLTKEELPAYLKSVYDPRPEKVIFIKGDPTVKYMDVIWAMDIARGAGAKVIGVPPPDQKAAQ